MGRVTQWRKYTKVFSWSLPHIDHTQNGRYVHYTAGFYGLIFVAISSRLWKWFPKSNTLSFASLRACLSSSVCCSMIVSNLLYACSAWWGFTNAPDRQRLNAFLRQEVLAGLYNTDCTPRSSPMLTINCSWLSLTTQTTRYINYLNRQHTTKCLCRGVITENFPANPTMMTITLYPGWLTKTAINKDPHFSVNDVVNTLQHFYWM